MGDELVIQRLGKSHPISLRSTIETACSKKNSLLPSMEDHRAQLYEIYRTEAKEYDEGFIKK